MSLGVITKVAFSQERGSLGNIVLKGKSPTILLDAAPHTQSFGGSLAVNTSIIAQEVIKQGLDAIYEFRVENKYSGSIQYSAQYQETHYNYLSRLAQAYGEQFFYDGEVLHFGSLPPANKPIDLVYGSNITDVSVEMNAVHTSPNFFSYQSSSNKILTAADTTIKHLGDLAQKSLKLNQDIFKTDSLIPAPISGNMFLDVSDSQKSAQGSAAVEVLTVMGNTTVPFLFPGCVADMYMRKKDTNQTSYFTRLMITEVSHEVDARGHYKGSFEAIAEGTGFLPKSEFAVPKAEPQIATVVSNADPMGQGRVQVRFDWQLHDTTHFIRVMSPDAGGTDAVTQNRGFVAIPEIGDQVMVGFEYHNPSMPFVMGGMFHGGTALGGFADNHLKSIQTRSGIKVLMNDNERSVTIQDPSGNTYFMDGQGNINVTAPNKITMTATDVEINANNNFDINVTNNMTSTVGNTALMNIMQKMLVNTPFMQQLITEYFHTQAGKALINSENEIKIEAKATQVAGFEKLFVHSDKSAIINSKGLVEVKGQDGTSNTNVADDDPKEEIILDANALVVFRPHSSWETTYNFGFDWYREGFGGGIEIGGTHLKGDQDFKTIAGHYLDNKYTFPFALDATIAESIKSEYLKGVACRKDRSYDYFVPKLTIYKHEAETKPSIANITVNFEVYYNEPDEFILEYEEDFFDIKDYVEENSVILIGKSSPKAKYVKKLEYNSPEKFKNFKIRPKKVTETFKTIDISLECKKPFGTLGGKFIKAYTLQEGTGPKNPIKKLAGVLQVIPNNASNRKIVNIVMVNVITDIDSNNTAENGYDNILLDNEKKNIRTLLRQSLIDPVFHIINLDLSGLTQTPEDISTRDHFNHTYILNGPLISVYEQGSTIPVGWKDLDVYLQEKFNEIPESTNFTNHIRLFYLPQRELKVVQNNLPKGYGGYNSGVNHLNIVLPKQGSIAASTHEIFHSLGLPHTWQNKNNINRSAGFNPTEKMENILLNINQLLILWTTHFLNITFTTGKVK